MTTDDGYELIAFHITGDSNGTFSPTKPPVVVMHGSSMDAASWLDDNSNNSDGVKPFQFMLADSGYDVFLANNRGTEYS